MMYTHSSETRLARLPATSETSCSNQPGRQMGAADLLLRLRRDCAKTTTSAFSSRQSGQFSEHPPRHSAKTTRHCLPAVK